MAFLKDKRLYLSGPIEFGGPNWREAPKRVLAEEFGFHVFDPFADPKQQYSPDLYKAREQKDYETIRRIAKGFIRKDLSLVDRSDVLVGYVPYKVATVGTVHEIINSVNAKKPTMLVCPQGKHMAAFWYFGLVPDEVVFGSWEALYMYLREVDSGLHKHNNRWSYIYGDI